MTGMMIALTLAAAAVPPDGDYARDQANAAALAQIAKGCDLDYDVGVTRGINYAHDVGRYLRAMLRDPPACPGIAQKAARFVTESVGTPERADVDTDMLHRAWTLVREGRLVRRDPAIESRYARMLWLFAERPHWRSARAMGWTGEEQPGWRAWSEGAEAVALLTERNAVSRWRTGRTLSLEAELRLRRDLPWYDPARAVLLLEDPRLRYQKGGAERITALLTDGTHLPPDPGRASRIYREWAVGEASDSAVARRKLLELGRLTEARDRSPAARALAINLYFGAALAGETAAVVAREAAVARLGRVPTVALAPGDAERIGRAIDRDYASLLDTSQLPSAAPGSVIRLRALLSPAGRVVMVKVTGSSGVVERDARAVQVWFRFERPLDLTATARGRFVWTDLPPVDAALTWSQVSRRWGS